MSRPAPKGWCPGGLTPMQSGDGLILRVRPRAGRLTAAQALGLAQVAMTHGSGWIDLTSRANLQIRGVSEAGLSAAQTALYALDLLDEDAETETRRNILTAPLRDAGDLVETLSDALAARLGELPGLPAKFGFAVDCGAQRQLAMDSADIRIERGADGLLIRADGADTGRAVTDSTAVDQAIALAHWFAAHRGDARRMRDVAANLPADWQGTAPVDTAPPPRPGPVRDGILLGAAFGSLDADALARLITDSGAKALITTPWRLFLLTGTTTLLPHPFIDTRHDPLLTVDACPGAPFCDSATVETRELAKTLARNLAQNPAPNPDLHVSGCAKGCARPRASARTLVGRDGRFDLVINGCSWEEPARRALSPDALKRGAEPL